MGDHCRADAEPEAMITHGNGRLWPAYALLLDGPAERSYCARGVSSSRVGGVAVATAVAGRRRLALAAGDPNAVGAQRCQGRGLLGGQKSRRVVHWPSHAGPGGVEGVASFTVHNRVVFVGNSARRKRTMSAAAMREIAGARDSRRACARDPWFTYTDGSSPLFTMVGPLRLLLPDAQ